MRGDGGDGCKEVRWGMSVVGGWSGGPAAKGGTAQGLAAAKSEGCWLEKEQQKSNTEGSGG